MSELVDLLLDLLSVLLRVPGAPVRAHHCFLDVLFFRVLQHIRLDVTGLYQFAVGYFVQPQRHLNCLIIARIVDILAQKPFCGILGQFISVAVGQDGILNITGGQAGDLAPHLKQVVASQDDLEQGEVALQQVEPAVLDLLELLRLQVSHA